MPAPDPEPSGGPASLAPTPRARFAPGLVFTLTVAGRQVYAQIDPWRSIAFFNPLAFARNRLRETLLTDPMCVLIVDTRSVSRSLRLCAWRSLGIQPMSEFVRSPKRFAHWPGFSETLVIWSGTSPEAVFRHDDPVVQDVELMVEWDAQTQIPDRLEHELGLRLHPKMTGPVWRERILRASYGITTDPPRVLKKLQLASA